MSNSEESDMHGTEGPVDTVAGFAAVTCQNADGGQKEQHILSFNP